jgi:anti-sigma regulatory factor (Ser/Thr protein kinase)
MIVQSPQVIDIIHLGNVMPALESARSFAHSLGFKKNECEQIAIVVSELANNLIKHANGGTIKFLKVSEENHVGIQVESEDKGPGIANTYNSLKDGFSTQNGLGLGLGAVNRMMDDFDIISPTTGGTRIICHRWLRPPVNELFPRMLEFGVATRPHRSEEENGDAFVIKCWAGHALVGVIDGLGHGAEARKAAISARVYIEDHFDQPLENIFKGVDIACRSTRGIVLALAHFDLDLKTFQMASVGNIESRVFGNDNQKNFTIRRGIVGLNAPSPAVTTHQWTDSSILVLYSDGLHSHWGNKDFTDEIWAKPAEAAHTILSKHGKDNDDVTILIVKNSKDGR